MPEKIRDLWASCYDGEFRQESPDRFKQVFCKNCLNLECVNSRGSGTSWSRRMATQVDLLLTNPKFADSKDPAFEAIRSLNFEERLEEALAKDVADRRGDWVIPSPQEVGEAAAELIGIKSPHFFKQTKPKETPDSGIPILEVSPRKPKGQWKIRGDSQNLYQVTQWEDDSIECTCPSLEVPCKHGRMILEKLTKLSPEEPPREEFRQPTPPPIHPPSNAPPTFHIKASNTTTPAQGLMIGGLSELASEPTTTYQSDPWAVPAKPVKTIPVGGRVRFGSGKNGG